MRHIILTHGDPDHAGGLADFPDTQVHISAEEHAHIASGQLAIRPVSIRPRTIVKTYGRSARQWFGLEARPVEVGFSTEVLLIPLFGHTLGHCGVAVQQGDRWLLHVGDAYYLREELATDDHPVSLMAAQRAEDDAQRRVSLEHLRRLVRDHGDEVEVVGYHDLGELPAEYPLPRL